MTTHKRSLGISLLETMLVLVLAAAMLLVGLRYYSQTTQQYRVSSTLKQLDRITLAASHWERAHRDGTVISMDALLSAGLLIPEDAKNLWSGSVVLVDDGSQHVQVQMTNVPTRICQLLVNAWSSDDQSHASRCEGSNWKGDLL